MSARPFRNIAIAILAATAVAACATHGPQSGPGRRAETASLPGKPACFWLRNVYDWTVLNNSELIVHAPLRRDAYLVKLFAPVFDLNFRLGLGFQDVEHTGQICNDSRDYLIVRDYAPPRIPIIAVHRLTMPEEAALLKAAGKHLASSQRFGRQSGR